MIELSGVSKTYGTAQAPIHALHPTDLKLEEGQVVGLLGFSGAGKSTLLRLINLLEMPSSGRVSLGGQDLTGLTAAELRQARQQVGMIFQQFNLLSSRTALENVAFALEVAGVSASVRRERAREALSAVGLSDKEAAFPAQLSGGQKQRVAIARALAMSPGILLCDEITSALDPELVGEVLAVVESLAQEGMTLLMVTHEMNFARKVSDRVIFMHQGKVHEQGQPQTLFAQPQTPELKQFLSSLT